MRSFDLFDTLLGRFHYSPESVFHSVAETFPFPLFPLYRMAAEARSNKTLPDIYRQLQELCGFSDEESAALMRFEFETELSKIFPITENLNLVQDGDLIISDTYYDVSQIRQILDRIGLKSQVQIYATPDGKASGRIWEQIKKEHALSTHLGDNKHSDVASPKRHGIRGIHYANSQLSKSERKMMQLGQTDLACLMRTLRLQNPYSPDLPEYLLWNDQCQINLPILILASVYLDALCKKEGKRKILFTLRDGCLWIQLFRSLFPHYECIPFHSSRYIYSYPTPSYIKYVDSLYSEDAIIVDIQATGFSCRRFFENYFDGEPSYLTILGSSKYKKTRAIARVSKMWDAFEMLNYDLIGTLYGFEENKPLRTLSEYDIKHVEPSHLCICKAVELLSCFKLQSFDPRAIKWALNQTKNAHITKWIVPAKNHCHLFENGCMKHYSIFSDSSFVEISKDSHSVLCQH
ncbi:MAG: hypothetical protein KGI80_06335 [Verrucomicrobiota bacterium]|nr:hypothetical protein [Verrucomicrobiota bacterium]